MTDNLQSYPDPIQNSDTFQGEMEAMGYIYNTLKQFSQPARDRIMACVNDRLRTEG